MIIKKIDIENFGKFSGKTIDFNPGFNLIFGENEKGKTTLMSFIKLLFYGGSSGKSTDIAKNIRKKYTPWNGASMSGAAEFKSGDHEYRLHKEFKKTAVSDKTSITNLTLAEKVELPSSSEVGEYFLDMDLGEFERSVFIDSYGGFSSEASGDSLAMRIANLSVSGDEGYSHDIVFSRISSAREELVSKNGKKGLLVDAQQRLDNLKAQYEELKFQTEAQFDLMENINNLKIQINALEEDLESISAYQKVEAAKKDLKLFTTLAEKFELHKQNSQKLGTYPISIQALTEMIDNCNQLNTQISQSYNISEQITDTIPDSHYQRLLEIKKEISQLESDYTNLDTRVRNAREKLENSCNKTSPLILIVFSVLAFLAAVFAVIVPGFLYPGLISFGLCAVFFTTFLLHRKKANSIGIQLAQREYETELRFLSFYNDSMLSKSIDELLEECICLKNKKINEINEMLAKFKCSSIEEMSNKTHSAQNLQYANTVSAVNNLKSRYISLVSNAKPVTSFEEAVSTVNEITILLDEINAINHDIETLSQTIDSKPLSPEFAKSQIEVLTNFIAETSINNEVLSRNPSIIKLELNEKRALLGDYQSQIIMPDADLNQLQAQISEAEENIKFLSNRYKSLLIVSEAMEASVSQMNQGLGSLLSKKTGKYLALMSKGKYDEVLVSRDLNVEARSSIAEGYHQWKYLSSGAIDRVYLALRLAVTDIIAEKHNTLPLFLDDVLAQYDEESCRSTLMFLNKYLSDSGSVSQILFFTCHRHIAELAREIIDDINEIEL